MGRSSQVWGPYERDPQNPIVTSVPGVSYERSDPDHLKPKYFNPDSVLQKSGHGSYVELPTGEVYLVHLCARPFVPELSCTLGRETAIQKMMWTEDGWLRMADGSNLAKMEVPESNLPEVPLQMLPAFDDFDSPQLGNFYYAPRIMPFRFADVTARPGWVRLRGQESRTSLNKVSRAKSIPYFFAVLSKALILSFVISMLETPAFCFISCFRVCFPCGIFCLSCCFFICASRAFIAFWSCCAVSFPVLM